MEKYLFIEDPGHGWLRVRRAELVKLGIQRKISQFSYQHGSFVFLEEDCDLTTYLNAKFPGGIDPQRAFFRDEVKSVYEENTLIRGYDAYYVISVGVETAC